MDHYGIMNQRLDICHREVSLVMTGESPHHVDGREGHVEVERERLFLSRLAVRESSVPLAVSQQELDLEPCPVNVHDVLGGYLRVRGELFTIFTTPSKASLMTSVSWSIGIRFIV